MATPSTPPQVPTTLNWETLRHLPRFARLYWRLFRDARVSWLPKAILILTAVYIISPIDLLPDTVPFFGEIDDLIVFIAACKAFMYLCPREVVREHVQRIDRGA